MLRKLLIATIFAASAIGSTGSAATANLIGDTITAEYFFPDAGSLFSTDTFVVGAGVEVDCPGASGVCSTLIEPYSLDFGADDIVFNQNIGSPEAYVGSAFNGWVFSGLDYGADIIGVSLSSFGIAGLDDTRLSFTTDSITLNLSGLSVAADNGWTLDVSISQIPLPAGFPLLIGALGALGLLRRRSS